MHGVVFSLLLLGSLRKTLAAAQFYHFRCQTTDHCCKEAGYSKHAGARLLQPEIQITRSTNLHLHRVDTAPRGSMAIEDVTARIGSVMRNGTTALAEMVERCGHEPTVAARPKPVADYKLGRNPAGMALAQRRHRMKVDQQCCAPFVPQRLERAAERLVIGSMDMFDAVVELCERQGMLPQFTRPGEATRHQTQPASRPAVGD